MRNRVLLSPIMNNPDYDSEDRRAGLGRLGELADLEPYELGREMRSEHAEGVIGVIADSIVDDPVNGPRAIHKDHPRIICTNHNGGITQESVARLDLQSIEQVTDAIHGREPAHILNREVLDHPRVKAWLTS